MWWLRGSIAASDCDLEDCAGAGEGMEPVPEGVEMAGKGPKTSESAGKKVDLGVLGQSVILCGRARIVRPGTERTRCEQYG